MLRDDFFASPGFDLGERNQPPMQDREAFQVLTHMLDTNLCIRVIRDRPRGLQERPNEAAPGLCVSMVTMAELLGGAERSARPAEGRRQAMDVTGRMEVLDFNADAAAHHGEIRATLERQGQVIGLHNLMIAGHARSRGLVVVAGNSGESTRVNGLRCEDW